MKIPPHLICLSRSVLGTFLAIMPCLGKAQVWQPSAVIDAGLHDAGTHLSLVLDHGDLFMAFSDSTGGQVQYRSRHQGGMDQWGIAGSITSIEPWYAHALAVADGRVAVGAPGANGAGAFTGEVRLYTISDQPGQDGLLLAQVLALPDQSIGDRFGYELLWVGDTLAVGAVGRAALRSTGGVFLFVPDADGLSFSSALPIEHGMVQAPFVRWFGAAMAASGDELLVTAPFTGFEASEPGQNVGSVHLFRRDPSAISGWTLDTAWCDLTVATAGSCMFDRMEAGRWGAAFAGNDILLDHARSYVGVAGDQLVPYQSAPEGPGCADCGLRLVSGTPEGWTFSLASLPSIDGPEPERSARGWCVSGDTLYVNQYDPQSLSWKTSWHLRDSNAPGTWGEEGLLMVSDTCDQPDGPLDVEGRIMARSILRRGTDCDVPDGQVHVLVEIFTR